ncbi:MAG: hypothetical protein MI921_23980 [Cytophagales bacterium]|nr:hypothetical protein [Cytophagales bacterium]
MVNHKGTKTQRVIKPVFGDTDAIGGYADEACRHRKVDFTGRVGQGL